MGKFKDARVVSFSLRGELVTLIDECSKATGLSKTSVVEQALTNYFKNGDFVKSSNASSIAAFSSLCEKTLN